MSTDIVIQLLGAAAIGLGAGILGALMVVRRMSLVGDALSHVALPGVAVALILHADPFLGAFLALAFAIVGIWLLERGTGLPSETLVGILFTTALAIGLLITPEPELLEALFGDVTTMTMTGMVASIVATVIVVFAVWRLAGVLIVSTVSRELAQASQMRPARADLIFFALVALVVALGIKVAGTLLTGSLVIIPAAAARNIAPSLRTYLFCSGLWGMLAAVAGVVASQALAIPPGPAIVLAAGVFFVISLPFRRN